MLDAAYFDQWYADMVTSSARDAIITRALSLPPELSQSGVVTGPAIAEISSELRLPPDGLLLDIACGRGGYGIEIARRADARLIGVDFSAVAVEEAAAKGAPRSEFRVGTLVATGLATGAADALMCLDAVQFAEPPLAGLREFHRLLKPGGRLALTCWEAVSAADERVPPRIRAVNLARDLPAAGFTDVRVHERPTWRAAERSLWEAAVAAADTDAAVRSLRAEGRRSLDTFDSLRRVFATATVSGSGQ